MSKKLIDVVITTTRRVYFGRIESFESIDCASSSIKNIYDQRQIIGRWHTTEGVEQLAITGPPEAAQLSAVTRHNLVMTDVKNVRICEPAAAAAWCRK